MRASRAESSSSSAGMIHGTTKSLYGADPDGLEFEIAWIIPAELLDDPARDARTRIGRLDLAKEKERYGAETQGGIRAPATP